MRASLADSEGDMICEGCARAADKNTEIQKSVEEWGIQSHWVDHPEDCKCPCMHLPAGSWKGRK